MRSYGEDSAEDAMRVSRSIMIVKPPGYQSQSGSSAPTSPAGYTPPVSPFSGKAVVCSVSNFNIISVIIIV